MLLQNFFGVFKNVKQTVQRTLKIRVQSIFYESFLSGTSSNYIEDMYLQWIKDPSTVHSSWQNYFKMVDAGAPPQATYVSKIKPATVKVWQKPAEKKKPTKVVLSKPIKKISPAPKVTPQTEQTNLTRKILEDHMNLLGIIYSYRARGHLMSSLDPLNLQRGPYIKIKTHTIKNPMLRKWKIPKDLSIKYELPKDFPMIENGKNIASLKSIIDKLENAYCQSIGIEMQHITRTEEMDFLTKCMESREDARNEEKKLALQRLCYAHHFEGFLGKKWPSEKRFGLEGCEVYIPALRAVMEYANDDGAQVFPIGMAHRGRLNTLANIMEKPLKQIFAQFQPIAMDGGYGEGDVKYHLGAATQIKHAFTGNPIRLTLCDNASHLESVNPIVTGKAAAEQFLIDDTNRTKVWPILVHGDAAVCGQGVVYETFHLTELHCYKTGGTVHLVINNQIGFTTDPYLSRSSEYCTAVGKVVDAPIFHVNADDVEAVLFVCKVAAKYRALFKNDVVIDLVSYRRFGHNEVDEPMFTQPTMYTKIRQTKPIYEKYKRKLIVEKVVTADEVSAHENMYFKKLEDSFAEALTVTKLDSQEWLSSPWPGFFEVNKDPTLIPKTGADEAVLDKIGEAISTPPPNFSMHKGLQRIFLNRSNMLRKAKVADWAIGESFAFGSLLQEGITVRLSGQDCERGTFSHRHHVLHDQENGNKVNVLHNIFPKQASYTVCNSSLSEFGILGFEYGMCTVNPNALYMWEAQFGDFCNSAQIMFDQYVSSAERKWFRQAGIVCLLPHGLEGQGPEHSSARPERFLQSCNDDDSDVIMDMKEQIAKTNWFIVNPSLPANFFHVLRRQIKFHFRKPLIIFTPKALLRLPDCVSPLSDFIGNTEFRPYIPDPDVPSNGKVRKLLLCSGKVYYDLKAIRAQKKLLDTIAIGRVEQLCPLPYKELLKDATSYSNASVTWVQEEHKNQGAWTYVAPRLNRLLGKDMGAVTYIGRPPAASPATGHKLVYPRERDQFLLTAMT